uniref:Uncharacterized protein n=1 Tax=Timema bartmani TaxID=61472 RepID=A0A7R9F745_9NEOP|nr:unnamed protein product [Timema bartmani]
MYSYLRGERDREREKDENRIGKLPSVQSTGIRTTISSSSAGHAVTCSGWTLVYFATIVSLGRRKAIFIDSLLAFAWRESGKPFWKEPPLVHSTEIRTSIPPVIGSLVYCESSALEHAATEAGISGINVPLFAHRFLLPARHSLFYLVRYTHEYALVEIRCKTGLMVAWSKAPLSQYTGLPKTGLGVLRIQHQPASVAEWSKASLLVLDWPADDEEIGTRIPIGSTEGVIVREVKPNIQG